MIFYLHEEAKIFTFIRTERSSYFFDKTKFLRNSGVCYLRFCK